ncbi:unnamed protein product [Diatraea saccharalis]|uniref:CULT domain-containing protein n=1 Tax=Diatraea saccharalis TaxID=40085 RepID=A0A9N9N0U4_9NEOP|nr:unnamed protein product [Diatraea saccharalis]
MMFPKALLMLLIVYKTYATEDVALHQIHTDNEFILCRTCGNLITISKYVTDKRSPVSRFIFNDTIFNRKEVVVQELLGDLFLHFPVVTFLDSTCTGVGEWEESSWFPGYISRPCMCAECGTYLGWVFQPEQPKKNSELFFGFILSSLIGETFVDSLVIYPTNKN